MAIKKWFRLKKKEITPTKNFYAVIDDLNKAMAEYAEIEIRRGKVLNDPIFHRGAKARRRIRHKQNARFRRRK